jgi:hypothetical protein
VKAVYPRFLAGLDGDLVVAEGHLWLRQAGGSVSEIEPQRGVVLQRYSLPQPISAGSLLITPESLWTSASDDGFVLRIRR